MIIPNHAVIPQSMSSIGMSLFGAGSQVSGAASTAWYADNAIQLAPFTLFAPMVVRKVFVLNGATVNADTWAVAVYSIDGTTKFLECAATASNATAINTVNDVAITSVTLGSGSYLLALGCATTTPTFYATPSLSLRYAAQCGLTENLSGYSSGMPSAVTRSAIAAARSVCIFGISSGSVV